MSRRPRAGQTLTVTITVEPEYIEALRQAQEAMGLASPGRTAKVLLQQQLAQSDLLASVDREQRHQAIYEYRRFVFDRFGHMLEELREEMLQETNRSMIEREMGDV